jgi:hypothetical protein
MTISKVPFTASAGSLVLASILTASHFLELALIVIVASAVFGLWAIYAAILEDE